MDKLNFLVDKALSRRTFLAGAGSVAAAAAITGCSDDGTVTLPAASTSYSDADILNFALNLEYLEAEFYLIAATGTGLSAADAGTGAGTTTGGSKVTLSVTGGAALSVSQQSILNELAYTEQEHVRFLRSALGNLAVPRPSINLTAGFAGAVTAANALSAATTTLPAIPTTFSPFADFNSYIVGGFVFEDVGVTAYNGAAPLISSAGIAAGYLAAAAGIMAVEAYHSAYFRTTLTGSAIANGTTAYPYPLYANRLIALRAALGGNGSTPANETALSGFAPAAQTVTSLPAAGSTIVPADGNALAYHRNTDQVLHIVYGTFSNTAGSLIPAAGVASGGFFPNGMNGNIKVTQS